MTRSNIRLLWCAALVVGMLAAQSRVALGQQRVVRVFILAGQNNMAGFGRSRHIDTYKDDPLIAASYPSLKDGDDWKQRFDVYCIFRDEERNRLMAGPLSVGFGKEIGDTLGPELGFGQVVGDAIDDPVVILKITWGGSSLKEDFRPPSSPPSDKEVEDRLQRLRRNQPEATLADAREVYGQHYRTLVARVSELTEAIPTHFPNLTQYKPVIAGFVWHHVWNDKIDPFWKASKYAEYAEVQAAFIRDLRKDLHAPEMPFVIGGYGVDGDHGETEFPQAQATTAELPEFQGNVAFAPTAPYWDDKAERMFLDGFPKGDEQQQARWKAVGDRPPFLYLGSGRIFYLMGRGFGEAMLDLTPKEN